MDSNNDTLKCPPSLPYIGEYLSELRTVYIVLFTIAGVATLIICCLFIETNVFFWKHLKNWKPRDKAKWLVAVYPIVCVTAMVTLLVPRAATLNDLVSSSYLSVCIYLFVTMLIGHYGGASKMMKRLEGTQITLNLPPLACCCPCLPHPDLSPARIRLLEISVLQYAFVRPITAYISAVFMANDSFGVKPNVSVWGSGYVWLQVTNTLSVLIAMYGFQVIYNLSQVPLSKTAVRPKFLCLQSVLFINGIQESIIKLFVVSGVISCDPPLNPSGGADRIHHLLVIAEMFVINLVARKYYRRHVGTIPPEDALQIETRDMGAATTNSLLRDPADVQLPSSRASTAIRSSRRGSASTATSGFTLPDFRNIVRRFSRANSVPERSNLSPSPIDATKSYFERQNSPTGTVETGVDSIPDDSALIPQSQATKLYFERQNSPTGTVETSVDTMPDDSALIPQSQATKLYFERLNREPNSPTGAIETGVLSTPDNYALRPQSQQTDSTFRPKEFYPPSSQHTLPVQSKLSLPPPPSQPPPPPPRASSQRFGDLQDGSHDKDTLDPTKIHLEIRGSYAV